MAKLSLKLFLLALLAVLAAKVAASPLGKDGDDDYEEYPGDSNDQLDDEDDEEEEVYSGPPPVIHSIGETFERKPGTRVKLPCNVSNYEHLVVMWKTGVKKNELGNQLFSDNIRLTYDKRFARLDDNTLEIKNLTYKDSGEYICELSTPDKLNVTHTLHVYAEPKIVNVIPGPNHIVHKGEPLTIKCDVEGYPEPVITWFRKGKHHLPSGEESKIATSITFASVNRNHNGTYECVAENGFGNPARATIDIRVQYSPEIRIEKETVNTAEGQTSEITCTVHAEPKAKVFWYKEGLILHPSERITESKIGSRHILKIKNTQNIDFGTYTCFANNTIGRNQMVVVLSGVPSKAQFVSPSPNMQNGHSQILSWTVESNTPITRYKLMYRKKNTNETKVDEPEVTNPDGNIYTVVADISDLGEGEYEAALLSENQYGWSSESAWHTFQGMDYQKTEPQAKTVVKEEAMLEESKEGGAGGLRPSIFAALLIALMTYFHV